MITSIAFAAIAVLTAQQPFTAADETLSQIVARMAEGSGQPLSVAQKLADERLVIYAPEADWDELKEQLAWTYFAEWTPQADGTLLLDQMPAGQRAQSAMQRAVARLDGSLLVHELALDHLEPLTASGADELILRFLRDSSTVHDHDAMRDLATPLGRLLSRALSEIPVAELERHLLQHQETGIRVPLLMTSWPSEFAFDLSDRAPSLLAQYEDERRLWEMTLAEAFARRSPQEFAMSHAVGPLPSVGGPSQGSPAHFLISLSLYRERSSAVLTLFDEDDQQIHFTLFDISIDRQRGRQAQLQNPSPSLSVPFPWANGEPVSLPKVFSLETYPEHAAELQITAAKALAEHFGKSVMIPPLNWAQTYYLNNDSFSLAPAVLAVEDWRGYEMPPGVAHPVSEDARWLTVRRVDGPQGRSVFQPRVFNASQLQASARAVLDEGKVELPHFIELAQSISDEQTYARVSMQFQWAVDSSTHSLWGAGPQYQEAILLGELIRNDDRRLERGAMRPFGQLSADSQRVIEATVKQVDFIGIDSDAFDFANQDGSLTEEMRTAYFNGRNRLATPAAIFANGIPPSARVTLSPETIFTLRPLDHRFGRIGPRTLARQTWARESGQIVRHAAYQYTTLRVLRITLEAGETSVSAHALASIIEANQPLEDLSQLPSKFREEYERWLEMFRSASRESS